MIQITDSMKQETGSLKKGMEKMEQDPVFLALFPECVTLVQIGKAVEFVGCEFSAIFGVKFFLL